MKGYHATKNRPKCAFLKIRPHFSLYLTEIGYLGYVQLKEPELIEKRLITDLQGNLNIVELPFSCKRFYTLDSVPINVTRGDHAHKDLEQIFLVLRGSLTLVCSTPIATFNFTLRNSDTHAVYLPRGYWRVLSDFTLDTICLVLASDHYDETDYIRDLEKYQAWFKGSN